MNYRDLMYTLGGIAPAYGAIDSHRTGNINPLIQRNVRNPSEFDRYTQMAQFGQDFGPNASFGMRMLSPVMAGVGIGALGANELSKLIPGAQNLMGRIDPSFIPDETTSQPSWGNFQSGLEGLFEGMTPGLFQ